MWNHDFDPTVKGSEMILWTHSELVLSYDESDGTLSQEKDKNKVR